MVTLVLFLLTFNLNILHLHNVFYSLSFCILYSNERSANDVYKKQYFILIKNFFIINAGMKIPASSLLNRKLQKKEASRYPGRSVL